MSALPAALLLDAAALIPPHSQEAAATAAAHASFYPDVLPLLRRAADAGIPVYTLSGNAALLRTAFEYSYHGDMRGYVAQFLEGDLSQALTQIQAQPAGVLYVTAQHTQAEQAHVAGAKAEYIVRPGMTAAHAEYKRDFRELLQPHRHGAGCCG